MITEGLVVNLIEDRLLIGKDGIEISISDSASPIKGDNEEIPGSVLIFRDITESKKSNDELHRSEEELRLTLDATTDGIWKWNFMTNELYFSPRYYTILGYEPDEFPSNYENWQNLIHPDDLQSALGAAEEYLKNKSYEYENEFRLRAKNGDYRWLHTRDKVVERNEKGEAVRMIGNHKDITERKRMEADRERHLAAIEQIAEGVVIDPLRGPPSSGPGSVRMPAPSGTGH